MIMTMAMSTHTPKLRAELSAAFARTEGRTRLSSKYHTSPLKIAKTFPHPELHEQHLAVTMMDCSPGMMAGDQYDYHFRLTSGAKVFLTNQSFTKVHPSNGMPSRMRQTIELNEGALLEYLPEPVMLYKDAHFETETTVRLMGGGCLMLSELLCPGRSACGERFAYRRYTGRMNVYRNEELIFCVNQVIDPAKQLLRAPGSWQHFTHMGSFYLFHDEVSQSIADRIYEKLEEKQISEGWDAKIGVSLTYKYGIAVTMMGKHAWQLQRLQHLAWQTAREDLLGLQSMPPGFTIV
jgi:urease accessory protein